MLTLQFSGNATTGQVKEITHAGRRYLISPVVALREGILNDTYVSAAEFGKFASSWQGRPIPISHPRADGLPTSANTPDIWANDVLGHLWNVAVDGGALKGEIWIDLDKAHMMGERASAIVNRLRQGDAMEVSTGYFCEMEATPGTFNGKAYGGIARNIRPDHLALLPDEVGACSWADGCGTPRVNEAAAPRGLPELRAAGQNGEPMSEETPADVSANERNLFDKFLGWLGGQKPPEATETILVHEESNMNKDQLIAGLVTNHKCKFSKDKLQTWTEGDLQVLQESMGEEAAQDAAPEPPSEPPHRIEQPEAGLISPELDARLAAIESMMKGLTANSDREKAELVSAIVTNSHGAWSEADLMKHDLPKLQTVYSSYQPRDYSANAGILRVNTPEDEELLMQWPVEFGSPMGKKGA